MSPFDVHYNRAPLSGTVEFVRHHPGHGRNLDMGAMHRRVLARRDPYYGGSAHVVQNERTVTKINGTLKGSTGVVLRRADCGQDRCRDRQLRQDR